MKLQMNNTFNFESSILSPKFDKYNVIYKYGMQIHLNKCYIKFYYILKPELNCQGLFLSSASVVDIYNFFINLGDESSTLFI